MSEYRIQGLGKKPGKPLHARREEHKHPIIENVGPNRPEEMKQQIELDTHTGNIEVKEGAQVSLKKPKIVVRHYPTEHFNFEGFTAIHDTQLAKTQIESFQKSYRIINDHWTWNHDFIRLQQIKPILIIIVILSLIIQTVAAFINDTFSNYFNYEILVTIIYAVYYGTLIHYDIYIQFIHLFFYVRSAIKVYYSRMELSNLQLYFQSDVTYTVVSQYKYPYDTELRSSKSYYVPLIYDGSDMLHLRRKVKRGALIELTTDIHIPIGITSELIDLFILKNSGVVTTENIESAIKMFQDNYSTDYIVLMQCKPAMTTLIQEYVYAFKVDRIKETFSAE